MKRLISALLLISLALTLVSCFEKDLPKTEKEAIEKKRMYRRRKKKQRAKKRKPKTHQAPLN